jgi:hypothetical protein
MFLVASGRHSPWAFASGGCDKYTSQGSTSDGWARHSPQGYASGGCDRDTSQGPTSDGWSRHSSTGLC